MKHITIAQASALTGWSPAAIAYHARHGLLGPDVVVGDDPYKPERLWLTPVVNFWLEAYLAPEIQEFVEYTAPMVVIPAWDADE